MKVTVESTSEIRLVDGQLARVWKGETERGVNVTLYVTRVQVAADLDQLEAADLIETAAPTIELADTQPPEAS